MRLGHFFSHFTSSIHSFSYFTLFHRKKRNDYQSGRNYILIILFTSTFYSNSNSNINLSALHSDFSFFSRGSFTPHTFHTLHSFCTFLFLFVCLQAERLRLRPLLKTAPPPWPGTRSQLYCLADGVLVHSG